MYRNGFRPLRLAFIAIAVAPLLASAGCTMTRSTSEERVAWAPHQIDAAPALGTMALLVALDRVGPERLRDEKQREVSELLKGALERIPETKIVDGQGLADGDDPDAWTAASEHELVERARALGVDTIGLVSFDRYVGAMHLYLLPPAWSAYTDVDYRIRLLDVASGAVIGDIRRHRRSGGFLGAVGKETLRRDLDDDLRDLIAAHGGDDQASAVR